jgi:cytochrome oxidase Cu insertion factor (SCO1/SenC/PrrC family)
VALPKLKLSAWPIIVLVAVVLGGLGYVLGSLLSAGNAGARAIAEKGPGSVYDQPVPVADFTLTDQKGQPFSLSSTKGKIVIMAFLYTHCGDVCPYLALKMKIALEQLGEDAKKVELVAIDTDPERDTVPVLAAYSRDLDLYDTWHIVTGNAQQMKKVYQDLKITVLKSDDATAQESAKNANELGITLPSKTDADSYVVGLNDTEIRAGSTVARKYYGGYQIVHSAPFWVVDAQGNLRTSLDFSATPAQLVEGVRAYLKTVKS